MGVQKLLESDRGGDIAAKTYENLVSLVVTGNSVNLSFCLVYRFTVKLEVGSFPLVLSDKIGSLIGEGKLGL